MARERTWDSGRKIFSHAYTPQVVSSVFFLERGGAIENIRYSIFLVFNFSKLMSGILVPLSDLIILLYKNFYFHDVISAVTLLRNSGMRHLSLSLVE